MNEGTNNAAQKLAEEFGRAMERVLVEFESKLRDIIDGIDAGSVTRTSSIGEDDLGETEYARRNFGREELVSLSRSIRQDDDAVELLREIRDTVQRIADALEQQNGGGPP